MNEHKFLVTVVRYDNGEIAEVKDVFTTIKTKFKRQTSKKYATSKVIYELNKDVGKYIKDQWCYYNIT